jgi:NADPH2:quinone reductase
MMRAAWYSKNGPASEVLTFGQMPAPEPAPGEVRVRLHSSGVNPSDVKSRRSRPLSDPRIIPHSDGAGIIDKTGEGVPADRVGERVWIGNGQWQRPFGTAAEYIALPSEQAVALPSGTDFDAGACLGIPALTAFQAVHLLGAIEGKTVLVIGAAAAVGHYTTQIAVRRAGATVIGTVGSAEKAAHARLAGAAATIDYKRENVAAAIRDMTGGRGVDAVIDMDFSTTAGLIGAGVLAPHGTIVSYGSNTIEDVPIPYRKMLFDSLSLKLFIVYELSAEDRRHAVEGVTEMLAAGRLDHTIGARFKLDRIAEAHEAAEGGRVLGNVVIEID